MPVYFWGVQRVMLMHTAPLSEARYKHNTLYTARFMVHVLPFKFY